MKKIFALSFVGLVFGCDSSLEKVGDFFTGTKTNTVLIASQPLLIDKTTRPFLPSTKAEILGDWSSVCFVLVGDQPLKDLKEMDRVLESTLRGAKLKAVITLGNNEQVVLDSQGSDWSMAGKVLTRNEVSVCLSTTCKANLPVGATVTRIDVSSEPPISVQGIYWSSSSPPGGSAKKGAPANSTTQTASSACNKSS
jgi:hypothetical protein